jgi:hypothetical protein
MIKKITLVALLMGSMMFAQQKVYNLDKKDSVANYKTTGDVAVYKGETCPVYISKNGKLFIFVISKNGNKYKKYLK